MKPIGSFKRGGRVPNSFFFNNNNDIVLRTHGPYHRHKSTKSVLLHISAHYRNGVST